MEPKRREDKKREGKERADVLLDILCLQELLLRWTMHELHVFKFR